MMFPWKFWMPSMVSSFGPRRTSPSFLQPRKKPPGRFVIPPERSAEGSELPQVKVPWFP